MRIILVPVPQMGEHKVAATDDWIQEDTLIRLLIYAPDRNRSYFRRQRLFDFASDREKTI